jgi:hypothetical protein
MFMGYYTHVYFFASSDERNSNSITVAMSSSTTQSVVSNTIPQEKETEIFGEKPDSKNGTGNIQDDPEAYYSTKK